MKATIVSIIIAGVVIAGAIVLAGGGSGAGGQPDGQNVSVIDGQQIIELSAKGGYQPRQSVAKADLPTIIRFNTAGSFDCSSSVRIPSLKISRNLPLSGVTDIDIGQPKLGTLQGTCSMGMYRFEIKFEA